MKILVTGGAGFIGSHIVDRYINDGNEVVIVDNLSTGKRKNLNPKALFYHVDIRQKEKIKEIFAKEKPEILNHHAAQLDVRKSVSDPIFDAEVNILGLLNLLEAGIKNNLKKIIFASSGGVIYGEAYTVPTLENYQPLQPLSPYGVTKLTSELYLSFYEKVYNLPFVALRYANIYGPRQDPFGEAGVVAIFTKKLLAGENPVINGDGRQERDFTYVGDVVEANVAVLANDVAGVFNIGTSSSTTVNEIFQKLRMITKSKLFEKHGPAKRGEQKRSVLDASLAKKTFGWESNVSLEKGLRETVEFFRHAKKD